jgi:hypothetical protein
VRERIERFPPLVDQHAERQQRRAADPMLAVDQHLLPTRKLVANEGDSALEMVAARGLEVGSRQVQQLDSGGAELLLVVARFCTQIDDRADAVTFRQGGSIFAGEASTYGNMLGQPVKVGRPCTRRIIFFFHEPGIFFFVVSHGDPNCRFYCCLPRLYCRSGSQEWNNKALQLFRARMIIHSKAEPIRG